MSKYPKSRFIPAGLSILVLLICGCEPATSTADSSSEPTDSSIPAENPAETVDSGAVTSETVAGSEISGSGKLITEPLGSVDWESLVGKEVTIQGDLVVVDTYDLIRRGQVKVARQPLYIPTSGIDPNDADASGTSFEGGSNVGKVIAAQKFNDNATIILDDGSAKQNIFPPGLFPKLGTTQPTVRVGSVVFGVSGKIVKAGNNLLLVAEQPLNWKPAERPARPDVGEADTTVASFNVLNYFTTIDNGNNGARGADSVAELERQEAKIVAAITELNADVIGLMELENNLEAEQRLVTALNKALGKEAYKACGLPAGFDNSPGGSDSIRVGVIYRADRVAPVGDVKMINDQAFAIARTPIVQTFKSVSGGTPFTVIVNHFKSKGGASNAEPGNKNKGDGQSAFNAARRDQALAIAAYINEIEATSQSSRVLVIGDLNAYQQEDPIDALRAKGLVDLHEQAGLRADQDYYSYVYYGQRGSLDHALATKALANSVTGIATWHINSDEPRSLDYNQEFNPKPLYEANPFRSSDHDPVLIGIRN